MIADVLLSRLHGVKQTGPSRWMARCPAHDDRNPSLSIRDVGDKALINCLAGCGAVDVLEAVALDFSALYPERLPHTRPVRNRVFKNDVFDVVRFEAGVLHVVACDMHCGRTISEEDYQRLGLAVERLERIAEAAYDR